MEIIKYILAIYSWVAIGILIFFLARIAYFYEKTSGQQTSYYFLIIPAVMMTTGVVWYLMFNVEFTGQPIGDLLLFGGGVLLFAFSTRLQEFMTGERR
jgi:membrane protein CcdC involved in cytochrome C biogenesis